MKKKINSLTAGGTARSEIEPHSRWKDSYGEKITVIGTTESSITYVRDGYSRECVCSEYRFRNDFIFLQEETEKSQLVARENGRKKIAALRSALPLSVGSDGWDKGLK